MMNKQDKIEKQLKEKLYHFDSNPPKDMWARLEKDLISAEPLSDVVGSSSKLNLFRRLVPFAVASSVLLGVMLAYNLAQRNAEAQLLAVIDNYNDSETITQESEEVDEVETLDLQNPEPVVLSNGGKDKLAVAKVDQLEQTQNTTDYEVSDAPSSYLSEQVDADNISIVKADQSESQEPTTHTSSDSPDQISEQIATTNSSRQNTFTRASSTRASSRNRTNRLSSLAVSKPDQGVDLSFFVTPSYARTTLSTNARRATDDASRVITRSASDDVYAIANATEPYGSSSSSTTNTRQLDHHSPLCVGLSFSVVLFNEVSLETGLVYSYLESEASQTTTIASYKDEQYLHYIGIPLSLKYTFLRYKKLSIYSNIGTLVEQGIDGSYKTTIKRNSSSSKSVITQDVDFDNLMASVNIGAGAEIRIFKSLGFYLEPMLSYYFGKDSQPRSYRTDNDVNFSFKTGFRINFK